MSVESFPYKVGDRVVTPDGPGTIVHAWEPTIRMSRVIVSRDALAEAGYDPDVRRWAMSVGVALDNGTRNSYHALALKFA